MPQYKLTYFNARGRGEVSRYLFALAGVPYEDIRFEEEDKLNWLLKAPFGQAPYLEVDGKIICQSHAIERYLAKQFGFAGKTAWDEARVDMIMGCLEDYLKPCLGILYDENDERRKIPDKEKSKKYLEEQVPDWLNKLEKLCKENGHRGHLVGNEITLADLEFEAMTKLVSDCFKQEVPSSWDRWPELKAVKEGVTGHPKIKAWIAKRTKTDLYTPKD